MECGNLSQIEGLEGVSEVGDRIFGSGIPFESNADLLVIGTTLIKHTKLSEKVIQVSNGITRIYDEAFGKACEKDCVEEIILPPTVESIGKAAFRGRSHLKRVNIPFGVKEIPDRAFTDCESMERIYIPASVETIAISAFPKGTTYNERGCALCAVDVDADNENYCTTDGMLLTKDRMKLLFVPYGIQKQGFQWPEGIREVQDYLLAYDPCVQEIILPNTLISICIGAFSNCPNLQRVVLTEGI